MLTAGLALVAELQSKELAHTRTSVSGAAVHATFFPPLPPSLPGLGPASTPTKGVRYDKEIPVEGEMIVRTKQEEAPALSKLAVPVSASVLHGGLAYAAEDAIFSPAQQLAAECLPLERLSGSLRSKLLLTLPHQSVQALAHVGTPSWLTTSANDRQEASGVHAAAAAAHSAVAGLLPLSGDRSFGGGDLSCIPAVVRSISLHNGFAQRILANPLLVAESSKHVLGGRLANIAPKEALTVSVGAVKLGAGAFTSIASQVHTVRRVIAALATVANVLHSVQDRRQSFVVHDGSFSNVTAAAASVLTSLCQDVLALAAAYLVRHGAGATSAGSAGGSNNYVVMRPEPEFLGSASASAMSLTPLAALWHAHRIGPADNASTASLSSFMAETARKGARVDKTVVKLVLINKGLHADCEAIAQREGLLANASDGDSGIASIAAELLACASLAFDKSAPWTGPSNTQQPQYSSWAQGWEGLIAPSNGTDQSSNELQDALLRIFSATESFVAAGNGTSAAIDALGTSFVSLIDHLLLQALAVTHEPVQRNRGFSTSLVVASDVSTFGIPLIVPASASVQLRPAVTPIPWAAYKHDGAPAASLFVLASRGMRLRHGQQLLRLPFSAAAPSAPDVSITASLPKAVLSASPFSVVVDLVNDEPVPLFIRLGEALSRLSALLRLSAIVPNAADRTLDGQSQQLLVVPPGSSLTIIAEGVNSSVTFGQVLSAFPNDVSLNGKAEPTMLLRNAATILCSRFRRSFASNASEPLQLVGISITAIVIEQAGLSAPLVTLDNNLTAALVRSGKRSWPPSLTDYLTRQGLPATLEVAEQRKASTLGLRPTWPGGKRSGQIKVTNPLAQPITVTSAALSGAGVGSFVGLLPRKLPMTIPAGASATVGTVRFTLSSICKALGPNVTASYPACLPSDDCVGCTAKVLGLPLPDFASSGPQSNRTSTTAERSDGIDATTTNNVTSALSSMGVPPSSTSSLAAALHPSPRPHAALLPQGWQHAAELESWWKHILSSGDAWVTVVLQLSVLEVDIPPLPVVVPLQPPSLLYGQSQLWQSKLHAEPAWHPLQVPPSQGRYEPFIAADGSLHMRIRPAAPQWLFLPVHNPGPLPLSVRLTSAASCELTPDAMARRMQQRQAEGQDMGPIPLDLAQAWGIAGDVLSAAALVNASLLAPPWAVTEAKGGGKQSVTSSLAAAVPFDAASDWDAHFASCSFGANEASAAHGTSRETWRSGLSLLTPVEAFYGLHSDESSASPAVIPPGTVRALGPLVYWPWVLPSALTSHRSSVVLHDMTLQLSNNLTRSQAVWIGAEVEVPHFQAGAVSPHVAGKANASGAVEWLSLLPNGLPVALEAVDWLHTARVTVDGGVESERQQCAGGISEIMRLPQLPTVANSECQSAQLRFAASYQLRVRVPDAAASIALYADGLDGSLPAELLRGYPAFSNADANATGRSALSGIPLIGQRIALPSAPTELVYDFTFNLTQSMSMPVQAAYDQCRLLRGRSGSRASLQGFLKDIVVRSASQLSALPHSLLRITLGSDRDATDRQKGLSSPAHNVTALFSAARTGVVPFRLFTNNSNLLRDRLLDHSGVCDAVSRIPEPPLSWKDVSGAAQVLAAALLVLLHALGMHRSLWQRCSRLTTKSRTGGSGDGRGSSKGDGDQSHPSQDADDHGPSKLDRYCTTQSGSSDSDGHYESDSDGNDFAPAASGSSAPAAASAAAASSVSQVATLVRKKQPRTAAVSGKQPSLMPSKQQVHTRRPAAMPQSPSPPSETSSDSSSEQSPTPADVIAFLQQYPHLTYADAVQALAVPSSASPPKLQQHHPAVPLIRTPPTKQALSPTGAQHARPPAAVAAASATITSSGSGGRSGVGKRQQASSSSTSASTSPRSMGVAAVATPAASTGNVWKKNRERPPQQPSGAYPHPFMGASGGVGAAGSLLTQRSAVSSASSSAQTPVSHATAAVRHSVGIHYSYSSSPSSATGSGGPNGTGSRPHSGRLTASPSTQSLHDGTGWLSSSESSALGSHSNVASNRGSNASDLADRMDSWEEEPQQYHHQQHSRPAASSGAALRSKLSPHSPEYVVPEARAKLMMQQHYHHQQLQQQQRQFQQRQDSSLAPRVTSEASSFGSTPPAPSPVNGASQGGTFPLPASTTGISFLGSVNLVQLPLPSSLWSDVGPSGTVGSGSGASVSRLGFDSQLGLTPLSVSLLQEQPQPLALKAISPRAGDGLLLPLASVLHDTSFARDSFIGTGTSSSLVSTPIAAVHTSSAARSGPRSALTTAASSAISPPAASGHKRVASAIALDAVGLSSAGDLLSPSQEEFGAAHGFLPKAAAVSDVILPSSSSSAAVSPVDAVLSAATVADLGLPEVRRGSALDLSRISAKGDVSDVDNPTTVLAPAGTGVNFLIKGLGHEFSF